ncbi:GNAT family N-acetyltransferase [Streptacidiphilus monticola]|uniref:GNAT family N-acetyltransferase n=1 Tax=Streptacidiphilus monticola TaxID=2161674 RepID=A0ABW1G7H1_9ACTN
MALARTALLTTARLMLQETTPAEAAVIAAGGRSVWHWTDGVPGDGVRSLAGIVGRADDVGWFLPGWGLYVVTSRESGEALGAVGFHGPPGPDGCAELGYELAPSTRGRGLGTEAVAAMCAEVLGRPGVRGLVACTACDNTASQRLLLRCGFVSDGADGPLLRFRLTPAAAEAGQLP